MSTSCDVPGASLAVTPSVFPDPERDIDTRGTTGEHTAVLAGGCFWCVEAVFRELDGVLEVTSGYAGGTADTAEYRTVCSGRTGHAEVVQIRFDPTRISFGQLLKVFFSIAHDPTQLNRQGNDVGSQYRSAIFYAGEAQKEVAGAYIRQLNEAGVFKTPIVTTLEPLQAFYRAEDYHQDYAARNPATPYVAFVAAPKVNKLRQYFGNRVKGAGA
jgi:peptide-methionine (S)-S-oxide reductase